MKQIMKKIVVFCAVSTLAVPALGALDVQDAQAFALFKKSKSSSKRSHKKSRSSSSKKKSSSKRSSRTTRKKTVTRSRTTRRGPTTRRRTVSRRRVTTRTRPRYQSRRRTTHRTRHSTHRNRPIQRRRVHRNRHHHNRRVVHPRRTVTRTEVHHHHSTAPRTVTRHRTHTHTQTQTQTHVHHHHRRRRVTTHHRYYGSGDTSGGSVATNTHQHRRGNSRTLNPTEAYLTANAGLSGFTSDQLVSDILPGVGANLGFGAKRGWLAGELGLSVGSYRLDPKSSASDMTLLGVSADIKIQPSFFFIEPFALVGVGAQSFNDSVAGASATGGSLRLGAGVDFRVSQIALSAQYLYSQHGLFGDTNTRYQGETLSAQSDMLSLGVKLYF